MVGSRAATREAAVGRIAAPAIRFRDRYSLVAGLEDLHAHLAAVHRFMPGMRIERVGAARHCQGVAVVDWVARGPDGAERGRGQNVFTLGGDGRIVDVVGLWDVSPDRRFQIRCAGTAGGGTSTRG